MQYLLVILGYLAGSIPFGLLYGRLVGVDVRQQGSGNIGATNVNRLLGKKLGILTLVSDLLKGLLPMLIAAQILLNSSGEQPTSRRSCSLSTGIVSAIQLWKRRRISTPYSSLESRAISPANFSAGNSLNHARPSVPISLLL